MNLTSIPQAELKAELKTVKANEAKARAIVKASWAHRSRLSEAYLAAHPEPDIRSNLAEYRAWRERASVHQAALDYWETLDRKLRDA